MNRMNALNVVNAYKTTGLIPIRKAWTSTDARGGCAIDALARATTSLTGEEYAATYFDQTYVKGFIDSWDADDAQAILCQEEHCNIYLTGFWDATACRDAVIKEFDSVMVPETV